MIVGRRLPSILKRLFTGKIYRFSSSETASTQTPEEFEQEFQAIVTQTQLDKDEKYKEMAARFEREWTKLTEDARAQELRTVESELSPNEKKKVEYLVKQVEKMNILEVRYFGTAVRDAIKKTSSLDFFSLNMNSPLFQQLSE
jgi:Zn-dependent metalloprotease